MESVQPITNTTEKKRGPGCLRTVLCGVAAVALVSAGAYLGARFSPPSMAGINSTGPDGQSIVVMGRGYEVDPNEGSLDIVYVLLDTSGDNNITVMDQGDESKVLLCGADAVIDLPADSTIGGPDALGLYQEGRLDFVDPHTEKPYENIVEIQVEDLCGAGEVPYQEHEPDDYDSPSALSY